MRKEEVRNAYATFRRKTIQELFFFLTLFVFTVAILYGFRLFDETILFLDSLVDLFPSVALGGFFTTIVVIYASLFLARRFAAARVALLDYDKLSNELEARVEERTHRITETEALYRSVLNQMQGIVFLLDTKGTFTLSMGEQLSLLGLNSNEVIGQSAYLLYKDVDGVKEAIDNALKGKTTNKKIEVEGLIFETLFSPQINADGSVAGVTGYAFDVTEREKNEKQLRQLGHILQNSHEAIVITDPEGLIQYANPAWERLSGRRLKDVVGRSTPRVLKSGKQDEQFYKKLWSTIKKGKAFRANFINENKLGEQYTVDQIISPIIIDGSITGFVGFQRDITKTVEYSKNLEKALEEQAILSEQLQQRIIALQTTRQLLALTNEPDSDRSITLQKMIDSLPLLWERESLCAKFELRNETYQTSNYKHTNGSIRAEVNIQGSDNGEIQLGDLKVGKNKTGNPFSQNDQELLDNVSLIFSDYIRKMQEEQAVAQLNEMKNRFMTTLSHVIRTPLSEIRWNLELMLEENEKHLLQHGKQIDETHRKEHEDDRIFIERSLKRNEQLGQIISSMSLSLDIQRETIVYQKRKTHLSDLVESVLQEKKYDESLKELNLSIRLARKAVPTVSVDIEKIRKVINELVENAFRYSHHGGHVTVAVTKVKNGVKFRIKDDGIGIPKSDQPFIGEAFYRGSNAYTQHPDGVGLGIFVTKAVLAAHGTQISIKSEEGKGTEIAFVLPEKQK